MLTRSWSQLVHSDHSGSKHYVFQMYLYKTSWHCHDMFRPEGMEIILMNYSQVIVISCTHTLHCKGKKMRAYALTFSIKNTNREEHLCILHTPM